MTESDDFDRFRKKFDVEDPAFAEQVLPTLTVALSRQRVTDLRTEISAIIEELYATLVRNRCGIKLIDRSARDLPELATVWFEGARGGLIHLLSQYLDDRVRRKLLHPLPDTAAAARLMLETTVFWAVHRHWDREPQTVSDNVAKETLKHFLVRALVKEG